MFMMDEKKKTIDQAERLLEGKKFAEAISLCEELHKEYPDEDSVILMLSWAYYDSGDSERAVHYLNILLERELSRKVFTGFAFDELVRIYKQKEDFGKLKEICERAVAAQPEDVCLLTELGNAYLRSSDALRACAIYEKLTAIESDNPVYYCQWGEALFAAGFAKESQEAYFKAAAIDPEQPDRYYFKIAVLFQKDQHHQEAERLFKQCISVNSSNPLYYCSLGDSFIGLGRIQDAMAVYEKAAECDPLRAGSYYNRLGNSLMRAGNYSEAVNAFTSAIKCEPIKTYYLGLASAYQAMGDHDQSEWIMNEMDKKR